ncbi:hypothetical protein WJX73_007259 [Symbiochloris irregularis]|uniref:Uncharacterized protein n=1 Tax=Symbiochloris irregularis TaxID=706552 RepID=A0AAW1PYR3_9CHLO
MAKRKEEEDGEYEPGVIGRDRSRLLSLKEVEKSAAGSDSEPCAKLNTLTKAYGYTVRGQERLCILLTLDLASICTMASTPILLSFGRKTARDLKQVSTIVILCYASSRRCTSKYYSR